MACNCEKKDCPNRKLLQVLLELHTRIVYEDRREAYGYGDFSVGAAYDRLIAYLRLEAERLKEDGDSGSVIVDSFLERKE